MSEPETARDTSTAWRVLLLGIALVLAQVAVEKSWPAGSNYYPPVSAGADAFQSAIDEFGHGEEAVGILFVAVGFFLITTCLSLLPILLRPPFGRSLILPCLGFELLFSGYHWITSWSNLTMDDDHGFALALAAANALLSLAVLWSALRWHRQPSHERLRILVYLHQFWLQTVWFLHGLTAMV